MQEDYEESISLTLRTWSSRKSSKMRGENWKHRWLLLCLARLARKASMGKPVARLMIYKFIPMPQAVKIPVAKAAADKEWEKLENIPAWGITKVRNKSEVIDEARTKGIKVHFASLMDICHLKNAELETKHQK